MIAETARTKFTSVLLSKLKDKTVKWELAYLQLIAQWALKEFSGGNSLMDNAVALKLAMIKARE